MQLTSTGKAQCADRRCWNTQALLDLQRAPSRVRVAPNVYLDPAAFRRAMWNGGLSQFWSSSAKSVPAHKLQLMSTAPGGCDQFYWFKATTPTGGALSSSALYSLEHMLVWADADTNPYINYQVTGPLIGIDPTYGLNQTSTTSNGSCSAACLQVSTTSIAGSCCSAAEPRRHTSDRAGARAPICASSQGNGAFCAGRRRAVQTWCDGGP